MPSANSKTVLNFSVTDEQLVDEFNRIAGMAKAPSELSKIFKVALGDKTLFPNINLSGGPATYSHYLEKWIKGYVDAYNNRPSCRSASPKSACSDPAIRLIVQTITNANDSLACDQERHHNLFMSAENIQGNLLEEYIAQNVANLGWLWCQGNVLRAVDFCTCDGSSLLQVKNKSNTENSSSSAIRTGTQIKKWYRLGTRKVNGLPMPVYHWDELNSVINGKQSKNGIECSMNEEAYRKFLISVTKLNRSIITDK